jgi:hypothetical protein
MNAKNALVSIFLSVLVVSCRSTLPQQGSELKSAGAFSNNHVAMRGGKDETATTATHQHFLQGIIMQTPEGWMRLDMLEETARSYLSKRYKDFPPATPLGLSVEFAPTHLPYASACIITAVLEKHIGLSHSTRSEGYPVM